MAVDQSQLDPRYKVSPLAPDMGTNKQAFDIVPTYAKPPEAKLPDSLANTNQPAGIVGGSSGARTEADTFYDQLNKMLANNTQSLTPEQQASSKAYGESAGAQYDTPIAQATQQKEQGMAKDIVAGGERGGFMSTQFAGQAAVTPTKGGTFEGAGGAFEQQHSAYDMNIQALQNQKLVAMQQAKSAMDQYYQTGNQQAFQNAKDLMTLAQNHEDKQAQLKIDQANLAINQSKLSIDQKKSQADQATALAPALIGKTPEEIMAAAETAGITDPMVLLGAISSYQSEQQKQAILNSAQTVDMLSKTPVGGKVTIPGLGEVQITGTNAKGKVVVGTDPKTGLSTQHLVQTDKDGKTYLQDTGLNSQTMTTSNALTLIKDLQLDPTQATAFLNALGYKTPGIVGAGGGTGFTVDMSTATGAGAKNNNPGNIKGADGKFIKYDTPEAGFQALVDDITAKMTGGSSHTVPADGISTNPGTKLTADSTLQDMISIYAPKADHNDPKVYAATVAKQIGADPTTKLKDLSPTDVAIAVAKHDSGTTVTKSDTVAGVTGSHQIDTSAPGYTTKKVGATERSQSAIDQAALEYAMTGKMPSIGLGSTKAALAVRAAVQNRAAEIDPGGNIAANSEEMKADSAALKKQTVYKTDTERSLKVADQSFKKVIETFKNKGINTEDGRIQNQWINDFKKNLSGGEINSYNAALKELANEYSQVFARGGATTEGTRAAASDILNGNISFKDLEGVQKTLQDMGQLVISNADSEIATAKEMMNSIIPDLYKIDTPTPEPGSTDSGAGAPAGPKVKTEDVNHTFDSHKDSKGYVTPEDWSKVKQLMTNQGVSAQAFDSFFGKYKDPSNKNYQ